MDKAVRLMKQGQKQEAMSRLKQVVAQEPENVDAAITLAQWLAAEGQMRRAETILFEQVARNPSHGRANLVLAELLRLGKRYDEAERYYRHALRLLPGEVAVAYNLGLMLQLANQPQAAAEAYEEACRRAPAFAPAAHNLASLKLLAGDLDAAEQGFARALEIDPKHLNARYNLGRVAERRGRAADAESHYVDVLRLNPNHPDALRSLGSLLLRQNRNLDWAEKCLKAYIRLQPQSAGAYHELAVLLGRAGRAAEAIPCFEAAIEFSAIPASAPVRRDFIGFLLANGRIADAIARLEDYVGLWPADGNALYDVIRLKLAACRWERLPALCERLAGLPDDALPDRPSPYSALAVPGLSAQRQARIAERNAARLLQQARDAGVAGKKPRKRSARTAAKQTRIGYLFSDVDGLYASESLAEVVAQHDPARFEVYAYSFNAADSSDSCRRIAATAHAFHPLAGLTPQQAADTIRADKLDVLVDLGGWINLQHPPVLAARPAPIVVAGWTYPASLGDAELADFVLADAFAVPADSAEPFAQRVLRLPSSARPAGTPPADVAAPTRAGSGLPDDAFVFCAFAPAHQLNPGVFDAWCALLGDAPNAVLWLADPGEGARQALAAEAGKRGVGPGRIVFASPATRAVQRARLRLADAALDSFPHSASQAALDALAAGLPLVALAGDRYAGRSGAALLHAASCDDLIASTPERYRAIARALAAEPKRMAEVHERLGGPSGAAALDAAEFTRALESCYVELVGGGAAEG